eukprot:6868541-Prymnesium_polylepis.1
MPALARPSLRAQTSPPPRTRAIPSAPRPPPRPPPQPPPLARSRRRRSHRAAAAEPEVRAAA